MTAETPERASAGDGLPVLMMAGQKGQVKIVEEMEVNKSELQRLLDEEAREGKGELETYRKVMRIIGVSWREELAKEKHPSQPTKQ